MSNVHIRQAKSQPATRFVNDVLDEPMLCEYPPRAVLPCWNCRRRRWAEHMLVQCYYDATRFFCAPGHGCKKRKS